MEDRVNADYVFVRWIAQVADPPPSLLAPRPRQRGGTPDGRTKVLRSLVGRSAALVP